MHYKKNRINIISMGCSKNLIDSERLIKQLESKGYEVIHDPEVADGEFVVVNTCGFIADAKEESIEMILELCDRKKNGEIGRLAVMGCLSQRYMDDLKSEIPEVDEWYGKFDWKQFVSTLPDRNESSAEKPHDWERTLTTPPFSTYLKISEGCDRFCAFCAIPIITGRHTSRPMEEILEETRRLVADGVREFNVIAQELTSYGKDLYGKPMIAELVDRMADIDGVEWIRLHYAYPASFPLELLDVMARRENVCKYLDIALQHVSDKVLEGMRRHITGTETLELIEEMRRRVPDIRIRTTMMVGFPGEGDKEFEELLDFVRKVRFDRLGAFAYCEEDDTWAARHLADDVPEDVKQDRLRRLMDLQEEISLELNRKLVGRRVRVLVDRIEGDRAVGRTEWDSPEVDPEVLLDAEGVEPGNFVEVEITEAYPFELIAVNVDGLERGI